MTSTVKVRKHRRKRVVKKLPQLPQPVQPIQIFIGNAKETAEGGSRRVSRIPREVAGGVSSGMSKSAITVQDISRYRPPLEPSHAGENVWGFVKGSWGAVSGLEGDIHSGYKGRLEQVEGWSKKRKKEKEKQRAEQASKPNIQETKPKETIE